MIESLISRLIDNVRTAVTIAVLLLIFAYIKLQAYWSTMEIVVACVLSILIMLLPLITLHFNSRFSFSIPSLWGKDEDNDTMSMFDWVREMTERYRPGRRSWALPIGLDKSGNLVEISMTDTESHAILTAKSGSGKSTLLNQIILAAANSGFWQVVVLSMSGKDFQVADKHYNIHLIDYEDDIVSYTSDIPEIIDAAEEEINRRMALLKHYNVTEVEALRRTQRPPLVLLVIEELPHLIETIRLNGTTSAEGARLQRDFLSKILLLVNRGRAAGFRFLFVAQRATATIPMSIRTGLIHITFAVHNRQESQWATGLNDANAHKLKRLDRNKNQPGEVIMVGSHETHRLTIPWISPSDMENVVRHFKDEVPFTGHPTWIPNFTVSEANRSNSVQPQLNGGYSVNSADSSPTRTAENILGQRVSRLRSLFSEVPSLSESPVALTEHRFVAIGLCLLSSMPKSHIEIGIFKGRNGKYGSKINEVANLLQIENWENEDDEEE